MGQSIFSKLKESVTRLLWMRQLLPFSTFLLPVAIEAQPSIQKQIQERVDLQYNRYIVVARLQEGEITFYHAGSFQQLPEETIFEIGSITKSFTAHLALSLAEEGVFHIDKPIDFYVPKEVSIPDFQGTKITFRHLLAHTSGLKDPEKEQYRNSLTGNTVPVADYTLEDLYKYLESTSLEYAPGTKVLYSNIGYGLAGHILELVTGKEYFTLLKEKILDPLGMDHTFLDIPEGFLLSTLRGTAGGQEVPYWKIAALPAFGGLKSTAKDLSLYLRFLFFDSSLSDPSRLITQLFDPYLKIEGTMIATTLGWTLDERYGGRLYATTGKTLGFSSFMGFCPNKKEGIVLLTDANFLDCLGHHWLHPKFPLTPLYKSIEIAPYHLQSLSGTYVGRQPHGDISFMIQAGEGCLELSAPGEYPIRLYPFSKTAFFPRYLDGEGACFHFRKGGKKITLLIKTKEDIILLNNINKSINYGCK